MATVDQLVTRAAKTGAYTETELTAFRAALGPDAKPEAKEAALDGLMGKLEAMAADKVTAPRAAASAAPETAPVPVPAPIVTTPTPNTPTPLTTEQWLAVAPPVVRDMYNRAAAADASAKASLLAGVRVAALAAGYTEAELVAMDTPALQRLAAVAKVNVPTLPPVDMSGLGIMVHNQPEMSMNGTSTGLRQAVVRPPDAWSEALANLADKQKAN